MKIKIFNALKNKVESVDKINKSDDQWKNILSPEQFLIMRQKGTEPAYSQTCSIPNPSMETGLYRCAACGTDIFEYKTKFESGTGWPSFYEPVSELNVKTISDNSLKINRDEVLCARCDSHLGHVFADGPKPTGKRYCINTLALKLLDK